MILRLHHQPTPEQQRARRILDERTAALARRGAPAPPPGALSPPLLLCALGAETYALPIAAMLRVVPAGPHTPAPGQPPAMLGFFGRAGQVFVLLDLGLALGLPAAAAGPGGHLLLLRHGLRRFALRVDRALGAPGPLPLAEGPSSSAGQVDGPLAGTVLTPGGLAGLIDLPRLLHPFLPTAPDPAGPSGNLTP
jgi:purine-binding chemotaxis protein CheW